MNKITSCCFSLRLRERGMRPALPRLALEKTAQRHGVTFLKSHRKVELDQNSPVHSPEFSPACFCPFPQGMSCLSSMLQARTLAPFRFGHQPLPGRPRPKSSAKLVSMGMQETPDFWGSSVPHLLEHHKLVLSCGALVNLHLIPVGKERRLEGPQCPWPSRLLLPLAGQWPESSVPTGCPRGEHCRARW